jgi:WD40 repeat protein
MRWILQLEPAVCLTPLTRLQQNHSGCVNSLGFGEQGTVSAPCSAPPMFSWRLQLLVSGSDDETVRLWRLPNTSATSPAAECVGVMRGHFSNVFSTVFVPGTGDHQVVTGGNDGTCRLYDVNTQTQLSVMSHHVRKVIPCTLPIHTLKRSNTTTGYVLRSSQSPHVANVRL